MSHMAGRGRLDVYRINFKPVRHFIGPLCSCYSAGNLSQYYVDKASQTIGGRRLGTLICYMLSAVGRSDSHTAITEGKVAHNK